MKYLKYWLKYLILILLIELSFASEIRTNSENQIRLYTDKNAILNFQKLTIEKSQKLEVEKAAKLRFLNDFIYVWKIEMSDSLIGLAVLDNVKGKSMPITFLVIFDLKGEILGADVIKYRESIGGEIDDLRWLKQFYGKTSSSSFEIGSDIDAISGATISVHAITRGIKRIVLLFPYLKSTVLKDS